MNKSLRVAFAALVAGGALMSSAHASLSAAGSRAEQFAVNNQALQQESTAMPAGSPAVNKHARPADPIPSAATPTQEEAIVNAENRQWQKESTPMPAVSPPVNRYAKAFDPMPKPATKAQWLADNMAEEQVLQHESTK